MQRNPRKNSECFAYFVFVQTLAKCGYEKNKHSTQRTAYVCYYISFKLRFNCHIYSKDRTFSNCAFGFCETRNSCTLSNMLVLREFGSPVYSSELKWQTTYILRTAFRAHSGEGNRTDCRHDVSRKEFQLWQQISLFRI